MTRTTPRRAGQEHEDPQFHLTTVALSNGMDKDRGRIWPAPYLFDIFVYAIQGRWLGTSSKFPMIGHDCGPGGQQEDKEKGR
jgi:hypothetical protein